MGKVYRRHYKDSVGKPSVLTTEFLTREIGIGPAVVADVPLEDVFSGEDTFTVSAPTRLNSIKFEVSSGKLASGVVKFDLYVDGVVVVSQDMTPTDISLVYIFDVKNGRDLLVKKGQEIIIAASVTSALSLSRTVRTTLSYSPMEYQV